MSLSSHPMDPNIMRQQWRKDVASVCKVCGEDVYKEPKDSYRWGCPHCRYATFTPSCHFTDSRTTPRAA